MQQHWKEFKQMKVEKYMNLSDEWSNVVFNPKLYNRKLSERDALLIHPFQPTQMKRPAAVVFI